MDEIELFMVRLFVVAGLAFGVGWALLLRRTQTDIQENVHRLDLMRIEKMQEVRADAFNLVDRRIERWLLEFGVRKGWRRYRHIKTGQEYDLLTTGKCEATGEKVAIYSSVATREIWVRPWREFVDSERFAELEKENG